jgi:hypothetical protein
MDALWENRRFDRELERSRQAGDRGDGSGTGKATGASIIIALA